MFLRIEESSKTEIKYDNSLVAIKLENLLDILHDDAMTKIIMRMAEDDELINFLKLPKDVVKTIIDYAIEARNSSELINYLGQNNVIFFSFIISTFEKYKNYISHIDFKNMKSIQIECNKDNFYKAIEIAKKFKVQTNISCTDISLELYKEILSKYDLNELDKLNIKIYYQKNNSLLLPSQLYNISSIIEEKAKKIKKYNLSPMEQIMYAYDIVKERKYTKEKDDDLESSRDLSRVLTEDTIVCVGYVNIFNAILKCLGIENMALSSFEINHQRSLVYIDDIKYNIKGIYAFDPTWDSKRADENNYINNYNYFAMTTEESNVNMLDLFYEMMSLSFNSFRKTLSNEKDLDKLFKASDVLESLFYLTDEENVRKFESTIGMYDYLDENEKQKCRKTFDDLKEKYFASSVAPTTFAELLYNTRRCEYYSGMTEEFSKDSIIISTCHKYRKKQSRLYNKGNNPLEFDFEKLVYLVKYEEKLFSELNLYLDNIEKRISSGSIERDVNNVKLLKVLKKVYEKIDN